MADALPLLAALKMCATAHHTLKMCATAHHTVLEGPSENRYFRLLLPGGQHDVSVHYRLPEELTNVGETRRQSFVCHWTS